MSGFGLKEIPDKFRLKEYLDPEDITTTTTTSTTTTTTTTDGWEIYDYDGNGYDVIEINGQEWIVQSLRVETYSDGTPIPVVTDNGIWAADTDGAMSYYDNDEATNKEVYGALYNWYAVENAHGLCYFERGGIQELGWRIPTQADYGNLMRFIDPSGTTASNIAGGHLKEIGETHWDNPSAGTDTYGFRARGSGARARVTGLFSDQKQQCFLYSSGEYDATRGYAAVLGYGNDRFSAPWAGVNVLTYKNNGYAVRCVRDLP